MTIARDLPMTATRFKQLVLLGEPGITHRIRNAP
jgi:hypothetical protein